MGSGSFARRLAIAALSAALALVALVTVVVGRSGESPSGSAPPVAAGIHATTDATVRFWERRVQRDPRDFVALNRLADGYVRRARQRGDPADYRRAEAASLGSLTARPTGNYEAIVRLGLVFAAMHRFDEALTLGEQAVALEPRRPFGYALLGDALLALGRYAEAGDAYDELVVLAPGLASFARLAHLRDLHGDLAGAARAWRDALGIDGGRRAEDSAWAQAGLGAFRFRTGDLDGATQAYEQALAALPGYAPALAGLGAVRASERDYEAALSLYEAAVERQPDLARVAALGDLYAAAGRRDEADAGYALVGAIARLYAANGISTDLQMALYLADHGLRPAEAVRQARAAYTARPSIDAADTLAWALYRDGRAEEARIYTVEALRLGTADAVLLFHAGLIREATGDAAGAREALTRALALNPRFSALHADTAAAALARLEATAGRP